MLYWLAQYPPVEFSSAMSGIVEFQYVPDSRQRLGFACIHAHDSGVSVRRGEDFGVEHAGKIQVPV